MKKIHIILIAIALIVATVFVHHRNENKENAEMERFAKIIADETDNNFEKAATEIIERIKNDELLKFWVKDSNLPSDDSILSYFNAKYFNEDALEQYNRTLIVCDSNTLILYYDMSDNCEAVYSSVLAESEKITENLYHYDDATSDIYYIVKIKLDE